MEEIFARLSKAGTVLCGRMDADGRHTCDAPLAEIVSVPSSAGAASRRVAPLPGWAMDRKGVWGQTTSVRDRRAHGRAPARVPLERRAFSQLPVLVRCPKCRTVQWVDPARLGWSGGTDEGKPPGNRWLRPSPADGQPASMGRDRLR